MKRDALVKLRGSNQNQSTFREEVFEEILIDIATTTQGLNTILASKPHYPDAKTFYKWMYSEKLEGGKEDGEGNESTGRISGESSGIELHDDCSNTDICSSSDIQQVNQLSRLQRYEHARDARSAILEDEMLAISDTPKVIPILKQCGHKITVIQADSVAHRQLQVESRKWILSHLNANRWGDKKIVVGDKDEPIQLVVKHVGGEE